jgi:hypothetical protein
MFHAEETMKNPFPLRLIKTERKIEDPSKEPLSIRELLYERHRAKMLAREVLEISIRPEGEPKRPKLK